MVLVVLPTTVVMNGASRFSPSLWFTDCRRKTNVVCNKFFLQTYLTSVRSNISGQRTWTRWGPLLGVSVPDYDKVQYQGSAYLTLATFSTRGQRTWPWRGPVPGVSIPDLNEVNCTRGQRAWPQRGPRYQRSAYQTWTRSMVPGVSVPDLDEVRWMEVESLEVQSEAGRPRCGQPPHALHAGRVEERVVRRLDSPSLPRSTQSVHF